MGLIIPGVQVSVVRQVVPTPLGAAGVLGIIGCTELNQTVQQLQAYGSLQEVQNAFGPGTIAAMPELKQAFTAGLNQAVIVPISADKGAPASTPVPAQIDGTAAPLTVSARANGQWANQLSVRMIQKTPPGTDPTVDVQVFVGIVGPTTAPVEVFRNLNTTNGTKAGKFLVDWINANSQYITVTAAAGIKPTSKVVPANTDPQVAVLSLAGGTDPSAQDFLDALAKLEPIEAVDMVVTSHQLGEADACQVYAGILAHCEKMAKLGSPRIGFGQTEVTKTGIPDMDQTGRMVALLPSERFVFVAPGGYMGAVIGTIAGLNYYDSPTFKSVVGVSDLPFDYTQSDLIALIQAGVCAVDQLPNRGIVCVKGITTDQGPINVTRIADRAVRTVQNTAQLFIGLLNTEAQRLALKQLISQSFTAMENEGSLVPSVDGKSPAFVVSVDSTPLDFAQGIVQIAVAMRPVRSIDYIYANIMVQAF